MKLQRRMGKLAICWHRIEMQMEVFVAFGSFDRSTYTRPREGKTMEIPQKMMMRFAIEISKYVNAKRCLVVPGTDDLESPEDNGSSNRYGDVWRAAAYQTASVIDRLRRHCDMMEPGGLVRVPEPLNGGATMETYSCGVAIKPTRSAVPSIVRHAGFFLISIISR